MRTNLAVEKKSILHLLKLTDSRLALLQLDNLLDSKAEHDSLLSTLHFIVTVTDVDSLGVEFILANNYIV